MVHFPDDRNFPRSQDGSEPILGGSVGLNRILLTLKRDAPRRERPLWSAILVNAFTVFRNIYTKDTKTETLSVRFRQDIDLFRVYLDAYYGYQSPPSQPIPLVLYIPHYDNIPKRLLRTPSPSDAQRLAAFQDFIKGYDTPILCQGSMEATTLWTFLAGGYTLLPHVQLAQWLHHQSLTERGFGYRYGHPVLLLSHCPIDFHISKRIPEISLIESYQGVYRTPKEFGQKLSHADENIPFTTVTHRAFGDPVHILGMADRSQRKDLLEMAQHHHWMNRTSDAVATDVKTILNVSITALTDYRM